jgi:hypothetical protein
MSNEQELKTVIDELKENLKVAEKRLEELRKPRIRHGALGHYVNSPQALRLFLRQGGEIVAYGRRGDLIDSHLVQDNEDNYVITRYLFEDAK